MDLVGSVNKVTQTTYTFSMTLTEDEMTALIEESGTLDPLKQAVLREVAATMSNVWVLTAGTDSAIIPVRG